MGFFQVLTPGGTFLTIIGLRKIVPSRMALSVPFGLGHSLLRLYSLILSLFGVIVAHLTPNPYFWMASAASWVTESLVLSRFFNPRSKYSIFMSRYGRRSFSLTSCHMTLVISSPSSSTRVPLTRTFLKGILSPRLVLNQSILGL